MSHTLQTVLIVVLGLLVAYLLIFLTWGFLKVKWSAQVTSPEPLPLKASPQGLEHETAWLIQQTTGKTARVCTGSDKGLVDIEILDDAGQVKGIVQCVPLTLAYSFTPGNVQALAQVRKARGVKAAYLVTQAQFEHAVRLEAKRRGIRVIDGASFERLQQRVNRQPLVVPQDLFEDHSRWQRPGSAPAPMPSTPAPAAPRHVLIRHTPTVVVPRQEDEARAAYKPSVKPIPPEDMHKPAWPVAASYKRDVPSVIIKPVPTETRTFETLEAADDMTLDEAHQMLQARKQKPHRFRRTET